MIGSANQHPASSVIHTSRSAQGPRREQALHCDSNDTCVITRIPSPQLRRSGMTLMALLAKYKSTGMTQARANHVQVVYSFRKSSEMSFLNDSAQIQSLIPRARFSYWIHTSPYLSAQQQAVQMTYDIYSALQQGHRYHRAR